MLFQSDRKNYYAGIVGCVLGFVLGQFLLEVVSVSESPFGGQTLYIILGSVLTVFSILFTGILVKKLFEYDKRKKSRRKNSKVVFLQDEQRSKPAE